MPTSAQGCASALRVLSHVSLMPFFTLSDTVGPLTPVLQTSTVRVREGTLQAAGHPARERQSQNTLDPSQSSSFYHARRPWTWIWPGTFLSLQNGSSALLSSVSVCGQSLGHVWAHSLPFLRLRESSGGDIPEFTGSLLSVSLFTYFWFLEVRK